MATSVPSMGIVLLAAFLLLSCQPRNAVREAQPNRLPTATEVFELRSKCAALGEKLIKENIVGSALTQGQTSRYNPETNRCYVKLDVHTANLETPQENFIRDEYLYDGQTKEQLLSAFWKGANKHAVIVSNSLRSFFKDPAIPSYDEADALIEKFIAEKHKP